MTNETPKNETHEPPKKETLQHDLNEIKMLLYRYKVRCFKKYFKDHTFKGPKDENLAERYFIAGFDYALGFLFDMVNETMAKR